MSVDVCKSKAGGSMGVVVEQDLEQTKQQKSRVENPTLCSILRGGKEGQKTAFLFNCTRAVLYPLLAVFLPTCLRSHSF